MSTDTTTSAIVLTTAGRTWLEGRLERTLARLERVRSELQAERSDELIQELGQLREQSDELQSLLQRAVHPADVADDPTIVELGDEVEVEFPDGSRESFLVVHPVEAGMDEQRTSAEAPLARAVLGHRAGDRVTVTSPAGVYSCTIIGRQRID